MLERKAVAKILSPIYHSVEPLLHQSYPSGLPFKWEKEILRLFPNFFRYIYKRFQPSDIYEFWQQSVLNEFKNTIETNSKAVC